MTEKENQMPALNSVVLIGRLVRNPELKKTNSGVAVVSFTVAVDNITRAGAEKSTSFIPCTCWNKTAELVAKYCNKGSLVAIDGRLVQRSYEDRTGQKRSVVEVVADQVQFLEKKNSDDDYPREPSYDDSRDNAIHEGIDSSDDDLPF